MIQEDKALLFLTAMTPLQATVSIILAIIASAGATFGFLQFLIKRKDENKEKDFKKQIDKIVEKKMEEFIKKCGEIGDAQIEIAKEEVRKEFEEGLAMRGEEGKERFELNSKQIQENTEMIDKILQVQRRTDDKFDKLAESLTALNEAMVINSKVTKACAEGVRSTTYDRILLVANKALKRNAITISEKTNLKQLYESWIELQGDDPKISTYYEDCVKLKSIPDEEGDMGGV